VPTACRAQSCKLMILPDKCAPQEETPSSTATEFARYAEGSNIVLLHPCVGGGVDKSKYPHAYDVADGKLDVFGQLSADYVQQSAPHMRGIGNMLRRLLGRNTFQGPPESDSRGSGLKQSMSSAAPRAPNPPANHSLHTSGLPIPGIKLPKLNIDSASVAAAGCSNTADFSHQLHVAFSSLVTAACIFSGQPFHCAATRFPNDYIVSKTPSTAAGIHCDGCPDDGTLIYDHCKNHPHWVNISLLAEYAESHPDVDDPVTHLGSARAFVFGPTHDRCYQPPAMENVASFYKRYAKDPSQIKLVEDQPFPHTLPTNSTPYFNHSTPAGYDGPGECLRHVFGHSTPLLPAVPELEGHHWQAFDQTEFIAEGSKGMGIMPLGWLFVPPACKQGKKCKLLVLPGGCVAPFSGTGGSHDDFARYAIVNDIVILKPCTGPFIDKKRFPQNHENLRGMVDVYGQLSPEYATQKGGQMQPIGGMLRRLMGLD